MYPYLTIPKLEGSFFDFNQKEMSEPKTTVKALKLLCKNNGMTQVGRKTQLIGKVREAGLFPLIEKNSGPRWFFFDEAFGNGDHELYFLCMCGAPQHMHKRRFSFGKDGRVSPSVCCGNEECMFHIWAAFDDFEHPGKDWMLCNGRFYNYGPYDHDKHKMCSRLHNKRWFG